MRGWKSNGSSRISQNLFLSSLLILGASAEADQIGPFAQNVTRHVLLHELGHAIFRQFDVPILANEENMAYSFATFMVTTQMRDQAADIIIDRARSWLYEDSGVDPATYDHRGEHELDIRRAYTSLCLFYGYDPAEFADVVAFAAFSERDLADCSDLAPAQEAGWTRTLTPLLGEGAAVTVIYGKGPMTDAVQATGLMEDIADIARAFDWPEPGLTLHFDHCDSGASWSRSSQTILLCDDYVARFVRQAEALAQ